MDSMPLPMSCVEGVPPNQCNDTQGYGLDATYVVGALVVAAVVVTLVVLVVRRIVRRRR